MDPLDLLHVTNYEGNLRCGRPHGKTRFTVSDKVFEITPEAERCPECWAAYDAITQEILSCLNDISAMVEKNPSLIGGVTLLGVEDLDSLRRGFDFEQ